MRRGRGGSSSGETRRGTDTMAAFNVTEERREIMKNRHKNFKTWESLNQVLKY